MRKGDCKPMLDPEPVFLMDSQRLWIYLHTGGWGQGRGREAPWPALLSLSFSWFDSSARMTQLPATTAISPLLNSLSKATSYMPSPGCCVF